MSSSRIAAASAVAALALLASGCRSSSPATLTLPTGEVLRGSATTSLNGQYYVANARVNCSGTFDGRSAAGVAFTFRRPNAVSVNCSDGKRGTSSDDINDTRQAAITFAGGGRGTLSLGE